VGRLLKIFFLKKSAAAKSMMLFKACLKISEWL
jgi:hypothetical protein